MNIPVEIMAAVIGSALLIAGSIVLAFYKAFKIINNKINSISERVVVCENHQHSQVIKDIDECKTITQTISAEVYMIKDMYENFIQTGTSTNNILIGLSKDMDYMRKSIEKSDKTTDTILLEIREMGKQVYKSVFDIQELQKNYEKHN
ncbi:MAG: hypothetical protein NT007_09620 [Candidatus Kapabacteria bacterium]|nr:hypothetical protein [Candidatus Kapabacteria bacterium]